MGFGGGDNSGDSAPEKTNKNSGYNPGDVTVETLAPAFGPTQVVSPTVTKSLDESKLDDQGNSQDDPGFFSSIGNAISNLAKGAINAAPSIAANVGAFALGGPVGVMGLNAARGVIGQVEPENPLGQSLPETITGMIAPNMSSVGKSIGVSMLGAGASGKYSDTPQNPNTVSGAMNNIGSTVNTQMDNISDTFGMGKDEKSNSGTFGSSITGGVGTNSGNKGGTLSNSTIAGTGNNGMGINFNGQAKGFGKGFY